MNDSAKLQAIRPVILGSFKALIRDELMSANVIKTVDKNFDGNYFCLDNLIFQENRCTLKKKLQGFSGT